MRVPSILLIWLRVDYTRKTLHFQVGSVVPRSCEIPQRITTPGTEQAILSPNDPELGRELKLLTTSTTLSGSSTLGTERFKRYSSWPSLRPAVAILIAKVKSLKERNTSDKPSQNVRYQHQSPEVIDRAGKVIIKAVQREAFKEEFQVICSKFVSK